MPIIEFESSIVTQGRHVFLRGKDVNLHTILSQLDSSIQYVHLYCRSINYNPPDQASNGADNVHRIIIPEKLKSLKSLSIFSCFFLNAGTAKAFSIAGYSKLNINLFFEYVPQPFYFLDQSGHRYPISRGDKANVDINWLLDQRISKDQATQLAKNQSQDLERALATSDAAGLSFVLSESKPVISLIDRVPIGEFQQKRILGSRTTFDLSAKSTIFGNLAQLLNGLFSEACELIFKGFAGRGEDQLANEQLAHQNLSFIKRCTNASPDYSVLHQHAEDLLSRLGLAQTAMDREAGRHTDANVKRFFVPTQNDQKYYEQLERSLREAKAVQTAVEHLDSEGRLIDEIRKTGIASLSAMEELGKEIGAAEPDYDAILVNMKQVADQRDSLAKRKDGVIVKRHAFLQGLDAYQLAEIRKRDFATAMGAFDIVITLSFAIGTGNLGTLIPTLEDVVLITKDVIFEYMANTGGTGQQAIPKFKADEEEPAPADEPGDNPAGHPAANPEENPIQDAGKVPVPAPVQEQQQVAVPLVDQQVVVPVVQGPQQIVPPVLRHQPLLDPSTQRPERTSSIVQPPAGGSGAPSQPRSRSFVGSYGNAPYLGERQPIQPLQPLQPLRPLVPGQQPVPMLPVHRDPPGQQIQPVQPIQLGQPIQPGVQPVQPGVQPGQPGDQGQQGQQAQPGVPGQPGQDKPGEKDKPGQKDKPGEKAPAPAAPAKPAATIYNNVRASGIAIWKAQKAYDNNPIINGRGAADKQKQTLSEADAAAARSEEAITSASPPIDYFGLLADWDEVGASVENLFATLKAQLNGGNISGMDAFQVALLNVISRGRALLGNQQELQKSMQAFIRASAEKKRRDGRQAEIKRLKKELESKPMALAPYLDDLKASYPVISRKLMLNMHRCILSLKYRYSWDHVSTVNIVAGMSLDDWENTITELQESKLRTSGKAITTQKFPKLSISSRKNAEHKVFVEDWRDVLQREQKIPFRIPLDLKEAKDECDVRILDISAEFFATASTKAFKNVRYEVYIGPIFVDRDRKQGINCFYVHNYNITKVDTEGEWKFAKDSDQIAPARPALCGPGYIWFDTQVANVPLEKIDHVDLTIIRQGYTIPHYERKA